MESMMVRMRRARGLTLWVVLALVTGGAALAEPTRAASAGPAAGNRGIVLVRDDVPPTSSGARVQESADATPPQSPGCIGDGSSGNRVQMVYVRLSTQPSRLPEITTQAHEWAARTDRNILKSARATGAHRRVRWVTGPDCRPTVEEFVVPPPDGVPAPDWNEMFNALSNAGKLNRTDRKLLIASDFGTFCGAGEVQTDDRPGPDNLNNTQPRTFIGAVGPYCQGTDTIVHELFHVLGAVQPTAPNATPGHHCYDESDVMCYDDGTLSGPLRQVCDRTYEELPDCNHDDYFHPSPAAGSYLATHWNTANSSFLDRAVWSLPPDRPEQPTLTVSAARGTVTWQTPLFNGGSPVLGYQLTELGSGRVTEVAGGAARSATIVLPNGVPARFVVRARNAAGLGTPSIETDNLAPTPRIFGRARFDAASAPRGIAADPAGTLWIGTSAGLVKVRPDGVRTLIASSAGKVVNPPVEGIAVGRTPIRPAGVARHPKTGDIYVADVLTHRVRRLSGGKVYTVAGGGTKILPDQLAFDAKLNLYITEPTKHRVWKRTPDGAMTIFAGSATGVAGYRGDGGPATQALLRSPSSVVAGPDGTVYVADRGNHRIRRVDPNGRIRLWAGNGADSVGPWMFDGTSAEFLLFPLPSGLAWANGRLYAGSGNRIVAITPDRNHITYVGFPAMPGDSGDGGPGKEARLGDDLQLAASDGRLVVLDRDSPRVRQVARLGATG